MAVIQRETKRVCHAWFLASVQCTFILVPPMIVEVITSVFPSHLGNTEVLLLVDASGQSISRDLAFLPHCIGVRLSGGFLLRCFR